MRKKLLANHEYGDGYSYDNAVELLDRIRSSEEKLGAALATIQAAIDNAGATGPLTRHANLMLVQAVRHLDCCYCNYSEDAVGLFFAVDILPRLGEKSLWAYLEVEPEGWVVRDLRIEPASDPGKEIRSGRIMRSFGERVTWLGYERLPD